MRWGERGVFELVEQPEFLFEQEGAEHRLVGLLDFAEHLDERRLDGLVAIGVDEISYRRGQRYLTTVVNHQTGAIVWCSPGRNAATLQAFFTELGERRHSIRAVSIDMSGGYAKTIGENTRAEICFDPFHIVRLGQRAVDQVRRDE